MVERVNTVYSNAPIALYQSLELDVNMHSESIAAATCLWLAFKDPVKQGFVVHLHARQLVIKRVLINGIAANFTRKDGLRMMNPSKQKIFNGNEIDELYRSSLEITRDGELMIVVPDLGATNMELKPPKSIPKSSSKDVLGRYEKILKAFQSLSTDNRKYEVQEDLSPSQNNQLPISNEKTTHLLQIMIEYSIQPLQNFVGHYAGIVFRKLPSFARQFEKNLSSSFVHSQQASDMAKGAKDPVQCVYTAGFGNGSLRDVDGVRCWLPCVDHLDQRLVFDISILLSRHYHVISAGKRIPVSKQGVKVGKSLKKVHRFFTVNRIPVAQVGFFIGKVETYRMNFHKTKGKIWVATGLNDYVGVGALPTSSYSAPSTNISVAGKPPKPHFTDKQLRGTPTLAGGESKAAVKRSRAESEEISQAEHSMNVTSAIEPISVGGSEPPTKRLKSSSNQLTRSVSPTHSRQTNPSFLQISSNPLSQHVTPSTGTSAAAPTATASKEFSISVRRLYADAVYHTMLGFDLAIRVIQKFINHKYEYEEYTMIFIHELGRDYLTFDSFVIVDAKFLHTAEKIYLEMPTNLILLRAFLYSWLKSDIPIASYENEFIIHGVIGYLVEFYLEEVYGEDEGNYYLQKMIDTVISLEQQGNGFPLIAFYPERYETFTLHYGQYLFAKSTVLFHIIENKVGGRDTMRIALKQIVKAPPMFAATVIKTTVTASGTIDYHERSYPHESLSSSPVNALSPAGYSQQSGAGVTSPTNQHYCLNYEEGVSPEGQSPYSQGSISIDTPLQPNLTPYQGGYQSPYIQRGDLSPYVPYGLPLHVSGGTGTGGYVSALGSLTPRFQDGSIYDDYSMTPRSGLPLTRQYSQTSEDDWYKDAHIFERSTLTAESFILLLRNVSGATSDLDDTFLERYVYQHGILLLRINVAISPRIEGKTRTISISTDQIGYNPERYEFGKNLATRVELPVIMVEERDNNITRSRIGFGENKETHQQQAYAKPGRRAGKVSSAVVNKKNADLTVEESERRHRLELEKEARKSALQLVRDREYGIRYVIVDPSFTCLADVQNFSNDVLLIEQLNANLDELGSDIDKHKVYFQCQAIRNLSRASSIIMSNSALSLSTSVDSPEPSSSLAGAASSSTLAVPSVKLPEKSAKLQIKALSDCLLGITSTQSDNRTSSCASIFVRAEAAFGLARWQNEYSSINVLEEPRENHWPAMEALLECVFELYMDPMTKTPLPLNFQNESSVYLRNSLLFALSSIRSQHGETPWEIIETLIIFAEDVDQLENQRSLLQWSSKVATEEDGDDTDGEDVARNKIPPSTPGNTYYDATHYRAVVLLALSRIRFATVDCSSESSHPIVGIITFAKSVIEDAFTNARTISRIQYRSHDANFLPTLPYDGIDVAAAISCLAEMDIQTAHNLSIGKGRGESCSKTLSETAAFEEAILTRMKYQSFFLPPGVSLICLRGNAASSTSSSSGHGGRTAALMDNLKSHFHYFLCSPLIRLAAFEAFVRLCFALHLAHYERLRQGQAVKRFANTANEMLPSGSFGSPTPRDGTNSEGENATSFIAAVIEAFQNVIDRDPSAHVKQHAAQVLFDAILDKPARIVFEAISLSCEWFTYGWSDCLGLTLITQDYSHFHPSERMKSLLESSSSSFSASTAAGVPVVAVGKHLNNKAYNKLNPSSHAMDLVNGTSSAQDLLALRKQAFHLEGKALKAAISALHKIITQKCVFSQTTKSILLRLWLYVFENKVPPVLASLANVSQLQPLYKSIDNLFPHPLSKDRLSVHNPKDLHLLFNQALRLSVGDTRYSNLSQQYLQERSVQLRKRNNAEANKTAGAGRTSGNGVALSISLSRSVDPCSSMRQERGLLPDEHSECRSHQHQSSSSIHRVPSSTNSFKLILK